MHTSCCSTTKATCPAWTDEKVADALACGTATIARLRRRFGQEGLEAYLRVIKDRSGRPPKIYGAAEAI